VSVAGRKQWRAKTFVRKADAEHHLAAVVTDIARGDHIDSKVASTRVGVIAEAWLETITHRLKPKTLYEYNATLKNHVRKSAGSPSTLFTA
jgi:hypothetical protein